MEHVLSRNLINVSELKAQLSQVITTVKEGPLAILSHNQVKAYLVSKELLTEYQALKLAQEMDQRDAELTAAKGIKVKVLANGQIDYFGSKSTK